MINELVFIGPSGRDRQTDREGPTVGVSTLLTSARGDPGSERFDDKEWIAFGLAPESCSQFRVNRVFAA